MYGRQAKAVYWVFQFDVILRHRLICSDNPWESVVSEVRRWNLGPSWTPRHGQLYCMISRRGSISGKATPPFRLDSHNFISRILPDQCTISLEARKQGADSLSHNGRTGMLET